MNKPILFEDYYNITATTHNENPSLMIPIGINDQGSLNQVEITEKHWQHILVAGHAGSGKSTYLHTVLGSLLLNYTAEQVNIWLSDGGTCEFNRFAETAPAHIKRVNTSSDSASYIAFVDALEKEIKDRLKCLSDAEKNSYYSWCCDDGKDPLPRLIIIVDGFNHFVRTLSEVNRHYVEKLESIARFASACGITFIVSTQEALYLAQHISRSFFDLLGIRIATKQMRDSYDLLFESPIVDMVHSLKLGEAVTNLSPIQKVQLLYMDTQICDQIVELSITTSQRNL